MNSSSAVFTLFMISFIKSTNTTPTSTATDVMRSGSPSQNTDPIKEMLVAACDDAIRPFKEKGEEYLFVHKRIRQIMYQLFNGLVQKDIFTKRPTLARDIRDDFIETSTDGKKIFVNVFSSLPDIAKDKLYNEFNRKYDACVNYVAAAINMCNIILIDINT